MVFGRQRLRLCFNNRSKPSQFAFPPEFSELKRPAVTTASPADSFQRRLHLVCHQQQTRAHTHAIDSPLAINDFEEVLTYSKVIYFISPMEGSDKIAAWHCKSIGLARDSSQPPSTSSTSSSLKAVTLSLYLGG